MLIRLIGLCLCLCWVGVADAREPSGFGGMRIVSGDVGFEGCLESPGCAQNFYRFLSEATLEQGFAMNGVAVGSSAVVNRREGRFAGGLLHTFPFAGPRENLAGKEENTSFSPVFPKLYAGKIWSRDGKHYSLGGSILPPIPVGGASALNLGLDGSMATTLSDGNTRAGLEWDVTFVRARAPVTASEEQAEGAEEGGFEDNVSAEVIEETCDPDLGCIDTFIVGNFSVRAAMSWVLGEQFFPFAQVGLTIFDQWLHVEYDDSLWWGIGVQPTIHGGMAWAPMETVLLSAGTSVGLKQANQNPSGKLGAFYKFSGSATYHF